MINFNSTYWKIRNRIGQSFIDSIEYSLPHLHIIGLVGVVGFPLYYVMWNNIFPQPYENLGMRMFGCALFIGLTLTRYWPQKFHRYIKIYWFISFLYALPFFFTFMLLKNEGNLVWAMSTMSALTLLILIAYDWVLATVMYAIGSMLAFLLYIVTTDSWSLSNDYWAQSPIYLFVVVAGSMFNYKSIQLNQERLKVLATVGTDIAHEIRTPLLTIQNSIVGLEKFLPRLIASYDASKSNNPIRPAHLTAIDTALERAHDEVRHANTIVDMLLMNTGKTTIDTNEFQHFWMADVIDNALARYPFDSEEQRKNIRLNCDADFQFFGSDILMTHIIFNLIKNALANFDNSDSNTIDIVLNKQADKCNNNCLIFKDSGKGIPVSEINRIFNYDYTTKKGNIKGAGIGLAFCKKVMARFHGNIECQSEYGTHTTFKLSFPITQ